jgi:group I intron endonuclease
MLIYMAINKDNGLIYIGLSVNTLKTRLRCYRKEIHKAIEEGKGRPFIIALIKHGLSNFIWYIMEDDIKCENVLGRRETFWIAFYDSTNPKIGYNVSKGGYNGGNWRKGIKLKGDELIRARANALIGSRIAAEMYRGKPLTGIKLETTLENIKKAQTKSAEVRTGKPLSADHANNISKGLTGNPKVIAAAKRPRGKKRPNLTNEEVISIFQETGKYSVIAEKYKVSDTIVGKIKNKRSRFGAILLDF